MNSNVRRRSLRSTRSSLHRTLFPTLCLILCSALCLVSVSCGKANNDANGNQEYQPPEPPAVFEPVAPDLTTDSTDYAALALASFDGISPSEEFQWEETEDGLRLTSYTGDADKIIIPSMIEGKTVIALEDELFADHKTLTVLSIPDTINRIGTSLLRGCQSLRVLRTPQLGQNRDDDGYLAYLFGAASPVGNGYRVPSSLDTVILTQGTEVAAYAFYGCSRLCMVLLPQALDKIGNYAFFGCKALHYVPLPEHLTSLGDASFRECTSLVQVTLPQTLSSVGLGVYLGCTKLEQLTLPFLGDGNGNYTSLGYLFGALHYTWNRNYIPSSLRVVHLTASSVPSYAFYDCTSLAIVTLSDTCTFIGTRAFWGCQALQSVSMPDRVTHIGDLAFAHCSTLYRLTLPSGLTELGIQAFMNCTNLTEAVLPNALTDLPASVFSGCSNLRRITMGQQIASVAAGAFHGCVSLSVIDKNGSSPIIAAEGNQAFSQIWNADGHTPTQPNE